jgi:hypothetical protein
MSWASIIYSLCLLSSAACAWLLLRSYTRNGRRLLLWSAVCFFLLAINNLLVVVDLIVFPTAIDLALARQLASLAAVVVLLIAFIWELD